MTIFGRSDLIWNNNSLYLFEKVLVSIKKHPIHKNMFYLKWPDGSKSEDFYNLSRAKDHCYTEALSMLNNRI